MQIPKDEPFTYDNWCKYMAAGRTFHSGGPLIASASMVTRWGIRCGCRAMAVRWRWSAEAESVVPIHTLEVVQEGRW